VVCCVWKERSCLRAIGDPDRDEALGGTITGGGWIGCSKRLRHSTGTLKMLKLEIAFVFHFFFQMFISNFLIDQRRQYLQQSSGVCVQRGSAPELIFPIAAREIRAQPIPN
jgi:hypothetical protein